MQQTVAVYWTSVSPDVGLGENDVLRAERQAARSLYRLDLTTREGRPEQNQKAPPEYAVDQRIPPDQWSCPLFSILCKSSHVISKIHKVNR
jgi:hypothetical protein